MGKGIWKNISKNLSAKYNQNFLIVLKIRQQMHLELLLRVIQKTAEVTGDLIVMKLLIELQNFQKIHNKII